MTHGTLTLDAPAKVNLALSVGSPDPTTGMHPIVSWMVAIDFHDTVRLIRDDGGHGSFAASYADDAPRPESIDWAPEKDLAWRAWKALEQRVGRALPTAIVFEKRIPTGAGLGGGSSDAAAVLVGLDALWELGLSTESLVEVSATLGSDVPFLVHAMRGEPSMVATGLGEALRPARLTEAIAVVLVLPTCKCPTGPVYRAFDEMIEGEAHAADEAAVEAMVNRQPRGSVEGLFNDLAEPAMRAVPALRDAAAAMGAVIGDDRVRVTGSGSTLFTVASSMDGAARLAEQLRQAGMIALATRTITA
ncbi:MAG: 4-(cytidine 5'-diphospho)-2-C-methyl-D-erythritol kinase [Planctomycetota bacterium]